MKPKSIASKTERGQQTRDRVVEAALQLFAEHGYHGASMRQIADAATVAVGGIYNHFRNKEELLTAVILTWHPLLLIMPALAETEGDSLEEFVRNAAQGFLDTFRERPELLRIFMIEMIDFDGAHIPYFFETMEAKTTYLHERLVALDERFCTMAPLTFARLFLGTLIGFYITGKLLSRVPPPHVQTIGTTDDLVQVLVHGLIAAAASSPAD